MLSWGPWTATAESIILYFEALDNRESKTEWHLDCYLMLGYFSPFLLRPSILCHLLSSSSPSTLDYWLLPYTGIFCWH